MKEAIYLHLPLVRKVFPKNQKPKINYNNTLIKVQVSYITVVSDSKTHSEGPPCIYDSGRYYIVFTLWLDIVLIIVYLLRLVIIEIALLSKGVS